MRTHDYWSLQAVTANEVIRNLESPVGLGLSIFNLVELLHSADIEFAGYGG